MAGYADVIFSGGAIYTADPAAGGWSGRPRPTGRPATAVAIAGGTVVAVGHGRRRRRPRWPADRVR